LRDDNIALLTTDIDAAIAAHRPYIKNIDIRRFLRFVCCQRCVPRGLDLEYKQGLTGENHVAVAKTVDQHRLGGFEMAHHLVGDDTRFMPVLLLETQFIKDGLPGLAHIGLAVGMQFMP